MPKTSKAPKEKTPPSKKKTAVKKTKAPVKKTAKKPITKKTKKPASKKSRIAIDVISDEEIFPADNQESIPVFSTWPDFGKSKAEDQIEESEDSELIEDEEYDKQKKFFSDWASQITPKEGQEKPIVAPKKSIRLYRKQAFFYLGATAILLLVVFYLFFSKLTVIISPQGETLNDSLAFDIATADASSTASNVDSYNKTIDGKVQVIETSAEKTYQTSGEEVLGEEVVGKVTIVNKYNKNQPLVAKTRLLSPDGKLFRLKEAVNVPAGGSVSANVYADKPSSDMSVTELTRFTIPGLWAGLQDRIYAENSGDLVYQTQLKRTIKQRDLDQAIKDIDEVLDLKVKNDLNIPGDQAVVYGDTEEPVTTEINAKLGEEKADFIVKAKKKVVVVTFSKDKAADLAQARLSLLIPDDKQLSVFNKNQISYSLDNFDPATRTATVKAYFSGLMSLKSDASLLDRKKLVGLNRNQISQYLNSFPEIKDYELKFSPSFISTAPTLPDRISIKVQNEN